MLQSYRVSFFIKTLICCIIFLSGNEAKAHRKADSLMRLLAVEKVDTTRFIYMLKIGNYLSNEAKYAEAIGYYKKALRIVPSTDDYRVGLAFCYLSTTYSNKGDYDSSLYYSTRSVTKLRASKRVNIFLPLAISYVAAYYYMKGDFEQAIKYAYEELKVAEEINDNNSIANSYNLLCGIYQQTGNNAKAIEYSEKAVALKKKTGNYYNLAMLTINLAAVYINDQRYPEAIKHLTDALYISRNQSIVKADEAQALSLLGLCYSNLKQYDSAKLYYQTAGQVFREIEDAPTKLGQYYINLSTLERSFKKYDDALLYLDSAMHVAKQYNLGIFNEANRERQSLYAEKGDYANAYKALTQFIEMRDSIQIDEMKNNLAELEKKYNTEKKNKEILILENTNKLNSLRISQQLRLNTLLQTENILKAQKLLADSTLNATLTSENTLKQNQLQQATMLNATLERENDLKRKDLQNQRYILYLMLAGIFIVLTSVVLLYRQYRKQKLANETISLQSSKLSLLMKELHHRVKNNLQIVSSLLSLQSFRMQDEAAISAVKEGQHRIEAMSMIHQRLYTKDDVTEVNIKEFIQDIAESLMNAYGYSKGKLELILNIEDEMMNVDAAIPLSLILNELISNSLKHAFSETTMPSLSVSMNRKGNDIHISISDNGKGIDIDKWNSKTGSFGKELILAFTKQLKGKLHINTDKGTTMQLVFPYTT
jgi:two-component sensor histidine kinase/tetratricopeptide (TPR) repeat protein